MQALRNISAEEPATTRGTILAAARALALDVGFRRTTVADVARRAGLSRMTVYREFDDLAAIWSALLTDELVDLLDSSAGRLGRTSTARARIVALATTLVAGIAEHPLFRRALDLDPEVLLPLVVDRFGSTQRAALERLEPLLRAGQADGSVRADLPVPAAATAVVLTAQSYVFSARVVAALPEPGAVRDQLGPLLDRYLAP